MKNRSGPTKRPIVCTLGRSSQWFNHLQILHLQACTISFGHGNMWRHSAIGVPIGSNVSIVKPRGHVSCLAFHKWIGVGGEHFDWRKRDVGRCLWKEMMSTPPWKHWVVYIIYISMSCQFYCIHVCWCHVVLRLCYALLRSKSSLW